MLAEVWHLLRAPNHRMISTAEEINKARTNHYRFIPRLDERARTLANPGERGSVTGLQRRPFIGKFDLFCLV